jgi:hypothetical protein
MLALVGYLGVIGDPRVEMGRIAVLNGILAQAVLVDQKVALPPQPWLEAA